MMVRIIILALAFLVLPQVSFGEPPKGIVPTKIAVAAPDFNLKTLNGGVFKLSSYKGKVVIINFWATWCPPCIAEMPSLEALWERYSDEGLVIVGVTGDMGNVSGVKRSVKNMDLTFPIVLDPKRAARSAYVVGFFPTTYIVGREGKIRSRVIGEVDWNSGDVAEYIAALIDGSD